MIILRETSASQTIKFIPRITETGTYTFKIISEYNNQLIYNMDYTADASWANSYYYEYSDVFKVSSDQKYNLEVIKNGKTVFRDRMFCTNQLEYSINNDNFKERVLLDGGTYEDNSCVLFDGYISHVTKNEFITL